MRRAIRQPLAVVFALLVVTAGALGAVTFVNDDVTTLGDASDHIVQRNEAGVLTVAAITIGFAAGHYAYTEYIKNQPNTDDLAKADAYETHKAVYDQASIQDQNNDQTLTTYGNYLNDTQTIALMEGKNAYIKALENGSAESIARNRAIDAVADYYAVKQKNLIAAWNTTAIVTNSSRATVENESELANTTVGPKIEVSGPGNDGSTGYRGIQNKTLTAVNASSMDAVGIKLHIESTYDIYSDSKTVVVGPDTGGVQQYHTGSNYDGTTVTIDHMRVTPPDSNFNELRYVTFDNFQQRWSQIESQNDEVQGQLDTFINNTYDSYQQGDINASDLIDPYLGAREYDPETSSTWNLRTLSSMGLNGPKNLSTIGLMNITTDGQTVQGVLMTDETPAGGFVVNQTYNATVLNGSQYVAETNGDAQKLSGEFTITSAENTDGEQIADGETIEYRDINYQTADTQEFQALQQQLDELTAEINARQQTLRNSGGTGWLPQGVNIGQIAPIALIVGGALVLLGRN